MSPPGARQKMVSFGAKKGQKVPKGAIENVSAIPDRLARHCQLSTNQRVDTQVGRFGRFFEIF